MKEDYVVLLAQMTARPGKEQALKHELQKLVVPTQHEDGCIKYDLHISAENPAEFMFYEIWRDRESLKRHGESAHIEEFRKIAAGLLDGATRLTFYSPV